MLIFSPSVKNVITYLISTPIIWLVSMLESVSMPKLPVFPTPRPVAKIRVTQEMLHLSRSIQCFFPFSSHKYDGFSTKINTSTDNLGHNLANSPTHSHHCQESIHIFDTLLKKQLHVTFCRLLFREKATLTHALQRMRERTSKARTVTTNQPREPPDSLERMRKP